MTGSTSTSLDWVNEHFARSMTAALLGFEVYVGKEMGATSTAIAIVELLSVRIVGRRGMISYEEDCIV